MNAITTPLMFEWMGDSFRPLPRHAKACDDRFTIGERYRLEVIEERSHASHNHYFAAIAEAWSNLPEDIAHQWATPEHLRKFALIRTGFHDERSIVCASKAEAQRVAAIIKPMDEYAVVIVHEATVRVYTAKSQSIKAMGKEDFQASKEKVLEFLAELIRVQPHELESAAS